MPLLVGFIGEISESFVAGGHPCKLRTNFWTVPRVDQRPDSLSQLPVLRSLSQRIRSHNPAIERILGGLGDAAAEKSTPTQPAWRLSSGMSSVASR
jgi:hypothetical protein